MKKYTIAFIIMNIIMLVFLVGCTKTSKETPFYKNSNNPPEKALALIINNPTKEQLSTLKIKDELEIDKSGDEVLIIPKAKNTTIQVWSIDYKNGDLVQNKMIYGNKTNDNEFVLKIKINRPEGIPAYKIVISNGKDNNEYLFDYNGKTGTPHIEYI